MTQEEHHDALRAHVYPSGKESERPTFGSTVELDWLAILLETKGQDTSPFELVARLTEIGQEAATPHGFAHAYFELLVKHFDVGCACLRCIDKDELRFVHFQCSHAEAEPRVFSASETNIIVNAVNTGLPIIDGDQLKNKHNPTHDGEFKFDRDTGSILSFPYEDNTGRRWLFTSCNFSVNDAFTEYNLAVLQLLFPIFCAFYNSMCFRNLESALSKSTVASVLDIHRAPELRAKIEEAVEGTGYSSVFRANFDGTDYPVFEDIEMELVSGNKQNANIKRPGQADLLKLCFDNAATICVQQHGQELVAGNSKGHKMKTLPVPEDWPEGLSVAVVPVDVGTRNSAGCIWVEKHDAPPIDLTHFRHSKISDGLFLDLNRTRPHRGERVLNQGLKNAVLEAAEEPDQAVFVLGPHGSGKLFYSFLIHEETCPGEEYSVVTPNCRPEELADRMKRGGTVTLYRLNYFSPSLQVELLRLLDERTLEDNSRLNSRIVAIVGVADENTNVDPPLIAGLYERLRFSCIQMNTKALDEVPELIPDLVDYVLNSGELRKYAANRVDARAIQVLQRAPWPGNLPHLVRVLKSMCVNAGNEKELRPEHFSGEFRKYVGVLDLERLGTKLDVALAERIYNTYLKGNSFDKVKYLLGLEESKGTVIRYFKLFAKHIELMTDEEIKEVIGHKSRSKKQEKTEKK